MLARLSEIAGVKSAGAIELLPVTRARRGGEPLCIDGRPSLIPAEPRVISARYLDAMSIDVLVGRPFDASDTAAGPQVAVVNETLARRAWPGVDPIGRRIQYQGDAPREVVGVVRDVRIFSVDTPPEPQFYLPYSQTWLIPQQFVVKTDGNPTTFGASIRQRIHEVDPRASAEDMEALTAYVVARLAQPRFQASVLGIFAGSGLLLAIVGIAGVVAYAVSQRKRELGIRLALGATPQNVVRTVMVPCLGAVASGACVGVVAALFLGQFARGLLFEIQPEDPLTLVLVVAVLGGAALTAAWIPARRAAATDPIAALRAE
jgi:predicted permease